ncbi:hypothetical protein AB1Y20_005389 [Prymnesium parvum]|uniref:DFDF domain-containing protein n=1 Tax=Prymnesium parvum TaxID=97485 RepID=A0AB34J635_PRYPA
MNDTRDGTGNGLRSGSRRSMVPYGRRERRENYLYRGLRASAPKAMGSNIPYLGSKIVLISKSEIRYEGQLYTIDQTNSTVALQNVRSFGTEGRNEQNPIPPSNEVFDYIIFRGSDIKDLHVCESPTETPTGLAAPTTPAAPAPPTAPAAAPVVPAAAAPAARVTAAPAPAAAPAAWGMNPSQAKATTTAAAPAPPPAGVVRGGRTQPGTGAHMQGRATRSTAGAAAESGEPEEEFDIQAMLMGFNKVAIAEEASAKVKSKAYDKSAFFDSLDEEVAEDGPRKGRAFMDDMRKLDALTFGEELMKSSRGGKGRARPGGRPSLAGRGTGSSGDSEGAKGGKGKGAPRDGAKGGKGKGGGGKASDSPREAGKGEGKGKAKGTPRDGKGAGRGATGGRGGGRTAAGRNKDAETFGDIAMGGGRGVSLRWW